MKILFISSRIPQLDGKGDELVSFWRIKALRDSGHLVHLVCCTCSRPSSLDISALDALRLIGVTFDLVVVSRIRQFIRILLYSVFGAWPAQVAIYKSFYCRHLVKRVSDAFSPDIVHLSLIRSCPNIDLDLSLYSVDFVDSISLNYLRESSAWYFPLNLIYALEARRCHRLEAFLAQSAICSFAVSMTDACHISSGKVTFLPNGVDSTQFTPVAGMKPEPHRIIFTGNMSYSPNIKAVAWFCESCWSSILKLVPEAELYICGSSPTSFVNALGSRYRSVLVTGRVQSIGAEICKSSVAIAPMQSGAGMQNKILEAMSCGVPVVTTSLGLGSIGAFGAPSVLVADSPSEFIDSVVRLLVNKPLAARIGALSRDYVLRNHDWDSIGKRFVSVLESRVSAPVCRKS